MGMDVFVVMRNNCLFESQYRTTPLHDIVFHGATGGDTLGTETLISPEKIVRVVEKGTLSVLHSGLFMPDAFMPSAVSFVVSSFLKSHLEKIEGVKFSAIEFSKLVELAIPGIGDASWYDLNKYPSDANPIDEILSRPDANNYHKTVGKYHKIVLPVVYRIRKDLSDARQVIVDFGSYFSGFGGGRRKIWLSKSLLEKHPVVWDEFFAFREDAFSLIAPYLDRDYFSIARKRVE